jgi:hypothetical protein
MYAHALNGPAGRWSFYRSSSLLPPPPISPHAAARPHQGSVELDLTIGGTSLEARVSPLLATLLLAFRERQAMTAAELAAEVWCRGMLGLSRDMRARPPAAKSSLGRQWQRPLVRLSGLHGPAWGW